jgi:aspartyl-tRNA(Asn)/glutamyl-tRNA(Gln) amidotransferase subunit C
MANITPDEVAHIALLGRLQLTEEEVEHYTPQIDQILGYFRQLQKLDTSDIPPTSHAIQLTNVWREDRSRPSLAADEAVANAPEARDGLFIVPRIVGDAPDV